MPDQLLPRPRKEIKATSQKKIMADHFELDRPQSQESLNLVHQRRACGNPAYGIRSISRKPRGYA